MRRGETIFEIDPHLQVRPHYILYTASWPVVTLCLVFYFQKHLHFTDVLFKEVKIPEKIPDNVLRELVLMIAYIFLAHLSRREWTRVLRRRALT